MPQDVSIRVESNVDIFKGALPEVKAAALEAIGMTAEGYAKIEITKAVYNTPPSPSYKRTGRLRNSIAHARDDDAAYIGTNVEYAPYVELGTSKMKARPFLRPAATEHSAEYKNIVKSALQGS